MGKKPTKLPTPWHCVTPLKNWATAIGNMHKTFGKNHVYGSGDKLEDRQRDTHIHTDMLITILCPAPAVT